MNKKEDEVDKKRKEDLRQRIMREKQKFKAETEQPMETEELKEIDMQTQEYKEKKNRRKSFGRHRSYYPEEYWQK